MREVLGVDFRSVTAPYGGPPLHEDIPERGIHFAGEHTAPYVMRGYMNGAVMTGKRAAKEVLHALA